MKRKWVRRGEIYDTDTITALIDYNRKHKRSSAFKKYPTGSIFRPAHRKHPPVTLPKLKFMED
jgi:hypothetical protein